MTSNNTKQPRKKGKQAAFHLSIPVIAAAAVFGLALGGVIIAVMPHRTPDAAPEPEPVISKDYSQLSVKVFLAMPTGLELGVGNPSYQDIALPEKYVICQNGTQIAEGVGEAFAAGHGNYLYRITFPQLTPGQDYTLSAVTEDGNSAGAFSEVPFTVSQAFDGMIWIPDVKGMMIAEAEPLLTEKGVIVDQSSSHSTIAEIADGEICAVTVPRKPINSQDGFQIYDECYDGMGYWVDAGDHVILDVNMREE